MKEPDEDDWGKLKKVLKYLYGTRILKLTLSATDMGKITWYVDASYAVHDDCKGQSGGTMLLGKGADTSFLQKQKLNAKVQLQLN